ncbi:MAG TPA: PAS domain S-box protein [Blastocatellia bacterium]|nr:PAS domain S-box protein [Blastocatellia bacterium]
MAGSSLGRLLIVDDEIELMTALCEMLGERGYETHGYASGKHALDALAEHDFDLLITDLMMPRMDGIALLRAALDMDPNLVGIIMTGQGTVKTAVEAMKAGAFDYVLKPFKMDSLLPVFARAMQMRRLRMENLQLRETVAIHELSQAIAFTPDSKTILQKVADAAIQQCQADEVSIMLTADGSSELCVSVVRGKDRSHILGMRVPVDRGIAGWVARHREPLSLQGPVDDPRFSPVNPRETIRSSISMPMLVGNKLVGVLNVNATSGRRRFTPGQVKAVSLLAGIGASALESARAYTQIQEAEDKYRSLFENAVEGIFQATPDGKLITANPALARMLGYESAEEVTRSITDVSRQLHVNPEHHAGMMRVLEEQGVLSGCQCEVYRKDGSVIWVSGNARALRDASGSFSGYEGSLEDITDSKRAEDALRDSEEKFRTLADCIPAATYIYRGDQYVYANPAAEEMTGFSRDELLGMKIWNVIHPDFRQLVTKYSRARQKGEPAPSRYEIKVITKAGQERWCDVNAALTSFEGQPSVLVTSFDITRRKRAEEALRKSEERFHLVARATNDAVWDWDVTSNDVWWNENVEALFGYAPTEAGPDFSWWRDHVHPEDLDRIQTGVADALRSSGEFWSGEYRFKRADGSYAFVCDRGYVIRNDQGEPVRMIGAIADVTERKRTEEALRASEERYRDLFENANDIIYTHNLDGRFTSLNKTGELITGYTRDEALELNVADVVVPEDVSTARSMIQQKVTGESSTTYGLEIKTKSGRYVALEVSTRLILQQGEPVGVQGIARDVTDRKNLEDQLRQSQKMEAIGRLAGGVAHDFNNLLTAIIGYTSIVLGRLDPDDPLRRELEEVKNAGGRAASLTSQLLAFSRKQVLQPKVFDLNNVVTNVNRMLRRIIGEDVELVMDLDPSLGLVRADPGQIEQVVLNLAVNARDAMPRGGKLTIETANVVLGDAQHQVGVRAGPYVVLQVRDTGCGMDEETQSHIFEPFFTTKEHGKGTGLGLSTVYGIVSQSGGHIRVDSEPGKGTAFYIYLPETESSADHDDQRVESEHFPEGQETVLLVEDEPFVRELACSVLQGQGYSVLAAANGEDAMRLVQNHDHRQIHLLVTDVVMPQMSGCELAGRLAALRPDLKVIYVSGYADGAIAKHGIQDGRDSFLQKPFTPGVLVRKVREVLDGV